MSKKEFKDQCDICGEFNYCKGFDGMILCPKCFKEQKKNEIRKKENNNKNKESM